MRGASEGFKNEFLKDELLKDWIRSTKNLCLNKVDIFWNFPKNSKIPKRIPRFWKYPIPYIALGGRKPFRACYFWYPSRHHFYKFYKKYSGSIIEIEKSYWFLLSEPNPWQLTWLTYSQMRRSKEQSKWNVDFYLSRYVNMYPILTFIKNKDKPSFEFLICCSNPDMFDWSLSH